MPPDRFMNTSDIRRLWIDFFAERGHRHVPSSSLIPPPEERTLLFTNAGMNQMKPYFMAMAEPSARRMTSIQKCFRTSDIEEVGDSSHCTFFEMLGNFSVGDYFKAEVIPWAWELLTEPAPKGMGLDKDRLWATIFQDDDESFEIWRSTGVPAERIVRYGEKENYWFMGSVGPCGPNTEINYDFGVEYGCLNSDCHPNCVRPKPDGSGPCDRFLEIWNLVFMTLFQDEDGSRRPLPMRNVDTGAGLERWSPVLLWQNQVDWQGSPKRWRQPPTIYDTDLFQPLLRVISETSGIEYGRHEPDEDSVLFNSREMQYRAMRIMVEHARASAFLIADGVMPSNDGRGHVLRRLIRRAVYYRRYGVVTPMAEVAQSVIELLGSEHPSLVEQRTLILRILGDEERRFQETMGRGGVELHARLSNLQGQRAVPGNLAFYMYDTFGFPIELVAEIARDSYGLEVDEDGFQREMEGQRARSRRGVLSFAELEVPDPRSQSAGAGAPILQVDSARAERIQTYAELGLAPTEFVGYETTRAFASVVSIVLDGNTIVRELTPQLSEGHRVEITLDHSPFYAEGGGQVGDRGEVRWPSGRFVVEDTQHVGEGGVVAHLGRIDSGSLSVGDPVEAVVDEDLRGDTMRNHTGTHILHAALRKVLGSHVRQAGSLVTPDRLRFDFTHLEALTPAQVREVEVLANRVVRENLTVHVEHKSYEEALADGALAFFGDKYADVVRVVGVCDVELHDCFSHELCGGTHVHASGEVGSIIVTGETSIGAGLRRIEGVTGRAAAERTRQDEEILGRVGVSLLVPPAEIEGRIAALRDENDRLRKQLQTMERRLARGEAEEVAGSAVQIGGVSVVVSNVPDAPSADALRDMGDGLRQKLGDSVVLLGSVIEGKPLFLAMATPGASKRVSAGDVVRAAAKEAGGGGGGRPELAQGGGTDPGRLDAGLAAGRKLIEEKLGG